MKFVDNWKQSPRMWSQRVFAAIAAIQGSVLTLMSQAQLASPLPFHASVTFGQAIDAAIGTLALLGIFLRIISQDLPTAEEQAKDAK